MVLFKLICHTKFPYLFQMIVQNHKIYLNSNEIKQNENGQSSEKKMLVKEGIRSLIGNHPSDLEREQSIQV